MTCSMVAVAELRMPRRVSRSRSQKSRGRRHFEHLPLRHYGRPAKRRRWLLCLSTLLSCQHTPIWQSSVGKQGAERQYLSSTFPRAPTAEYSTRSWSYAPRSSITRPIRSVYRSRWTARSMSSTRARGCMTVSTLCITSSRASRPCTSSTTVPQARRWSKRRTCCPSWLLVAATRATLSGCSLRIIMRSSRTSGSKHAGLPCFTARTETVSRMLSMKTTWSPLMRREQQLGSCLRKLGMVSSCWRPTNQLNIMCYAESSCAGHKLCHPAACAGNPRRGGLRVY